MNIYVDLTTLKARLDITGTGDDTELLKVIRAASREIDKYTGRYFYVVSGTHYYDGVQSPWHVPEDILAITTLKLDQDGDGTYESTLVATTDYHLLPYNEWPKTTIKANPQGSYGTFAAGIVKGIQITGTFGYGDESGATPYVAAAANGTVATTTGTTLTISADGTIKPGHTLLCGSEQMYVSAVTTGSCTVRRGVNGTTAAVHAAEAIYIYQYPELVTEACLITAFRWWKRRESGFADVVGSADLGIMPTSKGLDKDVKEMLGHFVQQAYL